MAELDGRVAVLVEGESDRAAVLALAARRGVDLDDVEVVAMGGVTNVARYVTELGPRGRGLRLTGLYDRRRSGSCAAGSSGAGSGRGRTWRSRGSTGASGTSRTS
jgi:hypothetical protein